MQIIAKVAKILRKGLKELKNLVETLLSLSLQSNLRSKKIIHHEQNH